MVSGIRAEPRLLLLLIPLAIAAVLVALVLHIWFDVGASAGIAGVTALLTWVQIVRFKSTEA